MPLERNIEPYTLVCLYLQTLDDEALSEIHALKSKINQQRFEAKVIHKLEQQGFILYDWLKMKVILTPEGMEKARVLVKEILER